MARTAFSVPTSKWRTYVRLALVWLVARFITSGFSVGTYPSHDPNEDRAADFMVPGWSTDAGIKKGNALANYLAQTKVAKRLALWYVIWRGRIWSMTRPEKGWLPYFNRNNANPSKSHKNHVHVSFYDRAAGDPLYDDELAPKPYTDGWVPETPWVFYLDRQDLGVTKSDSVWLIQKALGDKPYDGVYDQALRDKVKAYQRDVLKDDPRYCDGILGPSQAARLFGDHVTVRASSK